MDFPHAIADAIEDYERRQNVKIWYVLAHPDTWHAEYSDLRVTRRTQPKEPQATGPEHLYTSDPSGPLKPLMKTLQGIAAKAGATDIDISRPARDAAPLLIWWTTHDIRTALRTPVSHHARIECGSPSPNSGSLVS